MYTFILKKGPEKQLRKMSAEHERPIRKQLKILAKNPFAKTNVKKISGFADLYRLRIGRWRVLYYLNTQDRTIEVNDIFMRKGKDYTKIFRMLFELL